MGGVSRASVQGGQAGLRGLGGGAPQDAALDLPQQIARDNRRVSNGEQYLIAVNAALAHPMSRQWKGH
jgi:hypothetical protein